jgi:UDP:flavonoid glycosyltransferase YjiC (YdhE family)
MRALMTCQPELGNFLPLTPIAGALVDAGHDVAFATPAFLRPAVEGAGFRWLRAGAERDDPELVALEAQRRHLRGPEFVRFSIEQIFAGLRPRRLVPDLLALAESWRPDVVVRDSREFGGLVAAELLDVPHAKVEVHAAGEQPYKLPVLMDALRRLRRASGLPERSVPEWLDRYLVLSPFPAVLTTPGNPVPPTAHHVRALPADDRDQGLPSWIHEIGSRPLVYVSMGNSFSGMRGPEIFSKLLAGVRDVDAEVVVTLGRDLDPAVFGPQPGHVHLERYLPIEALLGRCSLVLFHGGSGTLGHALAHGLPMIMLPLGADQPENAARCAELGASRTLSEDNLVPDRIREVVLDVLQTPSYRQAAGRLRDEFDALPGPDFAVELLERLAHDRVPIVVSR